jgi:hypothetical protein
VGSASNLTKRLSNYFSPRWIKRHILIYKNRKIIHYWNMVILILV